MSKWIVVFDGELALPDVSKRAGVGDALMSILMDAAEAGHIEDPCVSTYPERFNVEVTVEAETKTQALTRGMLSIEHALASAKVVSDTPVARIGDLVPA